MRKSILIGIILATIIASCSKPATNAGQPLNPTGDNTTAWIGIYTGTVGGSNTLNKVVVSKVNDSVVSMQLQTNVSGQYYTYATLQNVKLTTTTSATINENGLIATFTDIYHFAGSALLNGNNLTVSGTGTSTTNSSDVKVYYFSGNK